MKILSIEWLDAQSNGETWSSIKDAQKEKISLALTVGYLIAETEESITLSLSLDNENNMCGAYMVIPKINIKKKRILK